ncbi:MAG: acetyltransferase-like isoleucine patch superfamily enzyme [Urechidicola sp.]|jgi:acetyltransferase-like isoleucine patch superfamily enzyme|tara:strand:+ start:932 stop:1507 length:576 start_codon:yes stop_codon:yes gene_type:complete
MIKASIIKLQSGFYRWFTPKMVYGFKSPEGKSLKLTRISNSTYIEQKDKLVLGDRVFIGHHNFIDASNGLEIGEGCQITNFVSIISHSSHNAIRYYGKEYRGTKMKGYVKGGVNIGKYTFVGPHVTIMPNTTIGKGSIISSHSYVQGQFPDFSIIAGNPAIIIGDTREKDEEFFNKNPELKKNYDEWVSLK